MDRRPQHEALFAAKLAGSSGGGGGGTSDYTDLTNKPQINGVTLSGNKTSTNLGLQAALTFDSVPTDGSTNPVESNGVYDALAGKQDTIDSTHKLNADLVDDSTSTNKFAHVDNAGGLWIGSSQYIKIMDSDSYAALATKEDMLYLVYPTPSANLSMSASPRGLETLETPTEWEGIRLEPMEGIEARIGEENELTVEGGDDNADLQRDNGDN